MPGGDLAPFQGLQDLLGKLKEPQGVGHGGTGLAHPLGHLLLGQAHGQKGLVPPGLLHRGKVLPLEVLHQGQLQGLLVGEVTDHAGTSERPAIWAARKRRSPATSSNPSPLGRTKRGWRRPFSRMEAASSSRESWAKRLLGWWGLGRMAVRGRRTTLPLPLGRRASRPLPGR